MKYYMLLLFVLIGWSNIQIEEHNDDYNTNKDTRIPVEITKSELYFIEDQVLYYQEDFNNLIPLGSLDYVDGIKTISQDNVYQVHGSTDIYVNGLKCNGNRIYMIYKYENVNQSSSYYLASIWRC